MTEVVAESQVVMGIDIGTHMGYTVLDEAGNIVVIGAQDFSKSDRLVRWTAMRSMFTILIEKHTPSVVVIEGYGFGNVNSLATLVEYGTVVRLTLLDAGIPFIEIPPTTLKAFVCKGGAKKDEVRLAAYKKWGVEHPSNDAIDSYVAAQLARAVLGFTPRTVEQTKLLKKCQSAAPYMKS